MTRRSVPVRVAAMPWHPVLFSALIVLSAWLEAVISPLAVFRSLAGAIAIAFMLTLVGSLILRSWQLGGIVASALIWALWSKNLLDVGATALQRLGPFALLWFATIAAVVAITIRLARRHPNRWSRGSLTSFLNQASSFLLVATVLLGFFNGALSSAISDLQQGTDLSHWTATGDGPSTATPDIYVILLDGYPRADVLDYAFGIDNSAFTAQLAERGFSIAPRAHSDYLWTHVSVPSALNLDYVENVPSLGEVADGRKPQQPTIRHAIADSLAFAQVRERGYDVVAVASGFEEVSARQADVWVDGGQLNEFEISLLGSTFAGDLTGWLAPDFASSQQRDRIHDDLDVLSTIAAKRARPPAFVFAHIPAPHQPTVFGDAGAPLAVPITDGYFGDSPMERDETPEEFKSRYRAQLPYLNQQVLHAVDGILAASAEPPVIVLFADHGSASRTDWNETDPYEVDPTILLERTGTLFAALTPGHVGLYPDDISPTDMLRLLFDAYFGTDFGRATPPTDGGQIPAVDASVFGDSAAR